MHDDRGRDHEDEEHDGTERDVQHEERGAQTLAYCSGEEDPGVLGLQETWGDSARRRGRAKWNRTHLGDGHLEPCEVLHLGQEKVELGRHVPAFCRTKCL